MRNYYCEFTVISFVTISFHETAKGQEGGSVQKENGTQERASGMKSNV